MSDAELDDILGSIPGNEETVSEQSSQTPQQSTIKQQIADIESRKQEKINKYWDWVLRQLPESEKKNEIERVTTKLLEKRNAAIKLINNRDNVAWLETREALNIYDILGEDAFYNIRDKKYNDDAILDRFTPEIEKINAKYDAELAELRKASNSQQQPIQTEQPTTINEAMSKLKSDIQDYKEQQKKKEVGSDRQETSMGNKNTTMSIAEQAINSFNKVSRKKEIREILSSNNIKNIDSFMDYCIQNDKDVSTAILNADSLKSWIEKNIVCKQ